MAIECYLVSCDGMWSEKRLIHHWLQTEESRNRLRHQVGNDQINLKPFLAERFDSLNIRYAKSCVEILIIRISCGKSR